ncbi:hypothetical protein EAF04_003786 [Stromatinia cepivora]|nr:hypothetical protein EAF04_003786 [Stromatinia cepivora]
MTAIFCWYSQKAWYDTSMATARSANSNTVKPLTERTYQQGGTPARRQAFPPLSDRLRVDILRWIAKQTTFRKIE